ncbi:MAG: TIGR00730 family Rossman fold protein [Pseudomonadota bacterium]|nr:TIGR00730 family Rossman fold protein [Pseudomonadota bacterium]
MKRDICVFCGSGSGINPAYAEAARALGAELASRDIGLVYGGGSNGLMGELARAVKAGGGRVTGVIPEFLGAKERMFTDANELVVTATMHERKMTMFERSDGFIALPGGLGTLEELSEVGTWAQLDRHRKPIVLCNIEAYWDPLLALIRHMRTEEFIRPGLDLKLEVVARVGDAVARVLERLRTERPKVPIKPLRQQM